MHPLKPNDSSPETLSVSQLNRQVKRLLEGHFDFLWIEGELSNLARPGSGHWYFTLKDDNAQVRCAMFRNRNQRVRHNPENGQHIRIRARVSLYEGRGEFQLIVEHMEEAGAGAMQRAFEELKLKLANEGLFEASVKRALPEYPQRIALISSASGAAIRDIITVFARRFPAIELVLLPVTVQGSSAAGEIGNAIELANRVGGFDALVISRGGGSAEDLWAFNDEALARKIAGSGIPTVSAVGHEVDFTIADFVADVRAATPSAAAELLSPDASEIAGILRAVAFSLQRQQQRQLQAHRDRLTGLRRQLRHPGDTLREQAQRLDDQEQRLRRGFRSLLAERRHDLAEAVGRLKLHSPDSALANLQIKLTYLATRIAAAARLRIGNSGHKLALAIGKMDTLSPLATLQRGYGMVSDSSGRLITQIKQVRPGENVETRLADGRFTSRVLDTEPGD